MSRDVRPHLAQYRPRKALAEVIVLPVRARPTLTLAAPANPAIEIPMAPIEFPMRDGFSRGAILAIIREEVSRGTTRKVL